MENLRSQVEGRERSLELAAVYNRKAGNDCKRIQAAPPTETVRVEKKASSKLKLT